MDMDIATPTLDPGPATTGRTGVLARVEELTAALAGEVPEVRSASGPAAAAAIDELGALESLVCAAQARQAALSAALPESKGTASQVGLARRVSPVKGRVLLGLARVLAAGELPCTWAAFRAGAISEWRVTLIARETACLTLEERLRVDREVAGDRDRLALMGDRALIAACAEWANRLDPAAVVARRRKAVRERHVGLRPAPDQMTWLTALLPVADGVATHARLAASAECARLAGDQRSRGQVMADTLVEAITHHADQARATAHRGATTWDHQPHTHTTGADAAEPASTQTETEQTEPARQGQQPGPGGGNETEIVVDLPAEPADGPEPDRSRSDVCLNVIMTDRTLFGTADDPAWVDGYGIIDADHARELAKNDRTWLRRLFADPDTGQLTAMDARTRRFPDGLRTLIRLRDRTCRTPWCDAPIRHTDHIAPAAEGGPTSYDNGQGLCEACNHTKETTGWTTRRLPDTDGHQITTPTGHRYRTRAPAAPGHQPRLDTSLIPLQELILAS